MRARHNGLARGTPARKPRPPTQMLQTFTFYSRRRSLLLLRRTVAQNMTSLKRCA